MDIRAKNWKRLQPAWISQNPDRFAWLAILALGCAFLLWLSVYQNRGPFADQPDTSNWPPGVQIGQSAAASASASN